MKIHETSTRVRYQETDQMGVVYHSNYLIYFELGRTEFMRSEGLHYRSFEDEGIRLAVVEAHAKYLASARYDDLLKIRTWVAEHGPASIRFAYDVMEHASNKRLAEGYTELACIDSQHKLRKLPAKLQEFLNRHAN